MTDEPMTLVERLNNPAWVHGPGPFDVVTLDKDQTVSDMREGAGQILLLRSVLSQVGQFMAYFSGETNHFVGPGTPKSMLAEIRAVLGPVGGPGHERRPFPFGMHQRTDPHSSHAPQVGPC